LHDGVETVARHPGGYGLGNAGATALRRDVPLKAGESTYTELGVETGLLGALAFIAWSALLLWSLVRARAAAIAAAFAAVLALAVQTDVLGTPWLAFVVWLLAGAGHTAALRSGCRDVRSEGVA
jgi:O-antigen ligase